MDSNTISVLVSVLALAISLAVEVFVIYLIYKIVRMIYNNEILKRDFYSRVIESMKTQEVLQEKWHQLEWQQMQYLKQQLKNQNDSKNIP